MFNSDESCELDEAGLLKSLIFGINLVNDPVMFSIDDVDENCVYYHSQMFENAYERKFSIYSSTVDRIMERILIENFLLFSS